MRPRKTPSRLEVHRLRHQRNGRRGELLRVQELDEYERDLLQQELLKDVRVQRLTFVDPMDEEIYDSIQLRVFSEWGVMCVHPHYALQPTHDGRHRTCSVCGCLIFSRDNTAVAPRKQRQMD